MRAARRAFVKERKSLSYVELIGVTKHYGDTLAVDGVDLQVAKGEFFSLLGPSGCGKTTMLRMIAGFVRPTAGEIVIDGEVMTKLPPERRGIGIVFQNYAIFPHMNVYDNIAFGLRMRKLGRDETHRRVASALEQVGLAGYETRHQREMSGGEQQRVALARVLVTEPHILLLDEPLSALDKKLREEMKYWIKDLQHQLGITTIYVTHDQSEALTMSDRIAVVSAGRLLQVGSPTEIYERPIDRFVSSFIGESNILSTRVAEVEGDFVKLAFNGTELSAPARGALEPGRSVSLVVRPEHLLLGDEAERPGLNTLRGRVLKETYQGALIRYELKVGDARLVAESQNLPGRPVYPENSEIAVGWHPVSSAVLDE